MQKTKKPNPSHIQKALLNLHNAFEAVSALKKTKMSVHDVSKVEIAWIYIARAGNQLEDIKGR